MSLLTLCQWIQDTGFSSALRESTWGFPILGALHVLGIAWFGGALLMADLHGLGIVQRNANIANELRRWQWIGLAAMLLTGALLFWVEPLKCYHSTGFRVKMILLLLAGANAWAHRKVTPERAKLAAGLSLALWAGMIFAARAIAFF